MCELGLQLKSYNNFISLTGAEMVSLTIAVPGFSMLKVHGLNSLQCCLPKGSGKEVGPVIRGDKNTYVLSANQLGMVDCCRCLDDTNNVVQAPDLCAMEFLF